MLTGVRIGVAVFVVVLVVTVAGVVALVLVFWGVVLVLGFTGGAGSDLTSVLGTGFSI